MSDIKYVDPLRFRIVYHPDLRAYEPQRSDFSRRDEWFPLVEDSVESAGSKVRVPARYETMEEAMIQVEYWLASWPRVVWESNL